jgi:tetratricopeptide (TPR) repeat protein
MRAIFGVKQSIRSIVGIMLIVSLCEGAETPLQRKGFSPVGEIVFVAGKAVVRLVPEEMFRPAVSRQELVTEDMVKTAAGGRLSILFKDETQLKLASNTTLVIKEVTTSKEKTGPLKILLRLESGEVWTRSKGVRDGVVIETPYATAAIRGTEWGLSVRGDESRVTVLEGNVQLSNSLGSITVGRNEEGVVIGGQAPTKSIIVKPKERTQWTHYLTERRLLRYLIFGEGIVGPGEVLLNEGKLEESGRVFEERLSKDPADTGALTGLGLIALKKGDCEKAEDYLDRALSEQKGLLALLGKAYVLISGNQPEEAGEVLKQAKDMFPRDPLPYLFTSYLDTFYGDFPEALKECDRGLGVMPDNPLLLAFQVEIYILLDKGEEAGGTVERLVRENPGSSEGYEKMGLYHRIVTGDSRKAREALERSMVLDRFNDEAIAKLADLLREQGYIAEALKLIERAQAIAPWNAMHHYTYGRLLVDINRIDEAREEFKKSLALDPSFSRAYLGEGIVLLREGKTGEALKELSKANLFEPNLSEIHSFLGIAYYQRQDVKSALEELKKAEECDPLDSTPHQLASAIYNDLYMPVESIEEAKKVLELLPYRKASGEALLEGAQNGTMSVNYGLDVMDLPEWSLYYAQKAMFVDPYKNTSHIGAAKAYLKLGEVSALQGFNEYANPYFSELLQGQTLNVNSLNYSNRYDTLISKPGHYVTVGGQYGWNDSTELQGDVLATGDFGSRFPLTYQFSSSGYRDSGYLKHSKYKNLNSEVVLGYKPSYDQDFYADIAYDKDKIDVTPPASYTAGDLDGNQDFDDRTYWIELGYHKRFSPISHLLTDFRYFRNHDRLENPDPENDVTGFDHMRDELENMSFGLRHMFTLREDHQLSYGTDYNRVDFESHETWPYTPPTWVERNHQASKEKSLLFYAYDRWTALPRITLDGGLFLSYYRAKDRYHYNDTVYGSGESLTNRSTWNLNPRLGVSTELGKRGVLRVAYQQRSTPGFLGELSPVGCAGLIPPTFDIQFSKAEDVQGSVEYELTKTTFVKAMFGYETLSDLETREEAQLWYSRLAFNQILGRRFSFSVRYNYNDSKVLDGSGREIYGVPRNSGDARLVFVHPSQITLSLRESYVGSQYADYDNTVKLKGTFLTDMSAEKEFFKKKVYLSLTVSNLFDKDYQTLDHPYWWYGQGLPARGRTFYLRGEYRFSL